MKIQCDVCNKEEATLFCAADEASLCNACDHHIHHADKLASKHQRFTLLHPCSSKQLPLCDICHEKRAFLFCQQDRAILCRECDFPIHSANELTQKHNRFLLTGVKLSSTSVVYTPSNGGDSVPEFRSQSWMKNHVSSSPSNFNQSTAAAAVVNKSNGENNLLTNEGDGSTSSISKYLTETIPGWQVEDFLDSCGPPFGFCKGDDDDDGMLPFFDTLESNMTSSSQESLGVWVPQSPSSLYLPQYSSQIVGPIGFKDTNDTTSMKANQRWTNDAFTVPQISSPAVGSKRSRPLW